MSDPYENELATAIEAVREAGRLCVAVQAAINPETLSKKDKSPVTLADYGSQALVCRLLREKFPQDPVIAEEDSANLRDERNAWLLEKVVSHVAAARPGADAKTVCQWIDHGGAQDYCDRYWTLDPIDGTKGFLRREQYAVALALMVGGEPTVAALACPNLDGGVVFAAVRGLGAFSQPWAGGASKPIRVSTISDPAGMRFCESVEAAHSAQDEAAGVASKLGIHTVPLRMDSQCKYGVVASGGAEVYMRLPRKGVQYVERIWDHAAGALVVTEAGGRVSDITGKPLDFRHGRGLEQNRGVLASHGPMHDNIVSALNELL